MTSINCRVRQWRTQDFFSGGFNTRNFFGGFTPEICFLGGLHRKFFGGFYTRNLIWGGYTGNFSGGFYTRNLFFGGFTPGIFLVGFTPGIFRGGGSTNVVAEKGQREWGSRGGSPLVRGSTQFANE
jgi:hypothetical protein